MSRTAGSGRDGGGSALDRLRRGSRTLAFANPLYDMSLRGPVPQRLRLVPPDPWPGRGDHGHELVAGRFVLHGRAAALGDRPFAPESTDGLPEGWLRELHGFHWLRHLRASGGDAARRQAVRLVGQWLDTNGKWQEPAWEPATTGSRLSHWLSQYEFMAPALNDEAQARLLDSMARQTRHLIKQLPGSLQGAPLVLALKGWLLAALCLDPQSLKLDQALQHLHDALPGQLAGDGGHATRNAGDHLSVLRDLIDLRAALVADQRQPPAIWQDAIDRMTPVLRMLRHGDGGLVTMNGASENDPLVIDTALAQVDARGRPVRSLPETGYERIAIGRTVLVIDTGGAPPHGHDHHAHAGLFGFELSYGRERLIVSCGHDPSEGPLFDWLRVSAASSTLVVADTNASEVQPGGGIGRQPSRILATRETGSYGTRVVMSHDGWQRRYGLRYDRAITVSESGDAIFGEERLVGTAGHRFVVRFHLAPDVQVSPIQAGALLKLPGGAGWRFHVQGADLDVEPSLYAGAGAPRRCYQLVLKGETEDRSASALKGDRRIGAQVGWSLTRERKPARNRDENQSLSF